MKIFVATSQTQGERWNDFCFAADGEIVRFGVEHLGDELDGLCGCRRAMYGVESARATTTVKVVESDMLPADFRRLISSSFLASINATEVEIDLAVEVASIMADFLMQVAAEYQTGQVLERRGDYFEVRDDLWPDVIGG